MRFKKPIYFIFTALFLSGCSNPITESSRERGRLNSDHYYDVIFGYELNADRSGYVLKNVHTNCYYGTVTVPEFYQGLPVVEIGTEAFRNCDHLSEIKLPNSIKSIGEYSFAYCASLTSFVIPNNVTFIGNGAFSDCSNLKSLTLGSGVQTIEHYNFVYHCKRLVNINVKEDNPYFYSEEGLLYTYEDNALYATSPGLPGDLAIKQGTKRIRIGAFYALDSITSVTIPSSVETIDVDAFMGFSSLKSISVAAANQYFASVDGVLYNKAVSELIAFPCGKRASTFTVPNTVKKIGRYSFAFATGISEVILPEGLEYISDGVFNHTSYLRKINIPKSLLDIGDYVFCSLFNLEFLNLSSNITVIKPHLFIDCHALTSLVLPKSLQLIHKAAFQDCYYLSDIYYEGTKEEYDSITMQSMNEYFDRATINYYSETEPSETGNYWHYVDNEPVNW